MRTVAYMALHYGVEWMSWAIRSVRNVVDDVVVVYSERPTYGHSTQDPCPEDKADLKNIAHNSGAAWYEIMTRIPHEGAHRALALEYCKHNHGADIVVVLDADEVWDSDMLVQCLVEVEDAAVPKRNWRVPVRHFWRSLDWVCYDPAMPVRLIDLTVGEGSEGYISNKWGYVNHFGYAQSERIVRYKWQIHGHLGELRKGWLEDKFLAWKPGQVTDVHPTCADGFWNPERFDRAEIEHLVGDHPYYQMETIS